MQVGSGSALRDSTRFNSAQREAAPPEASACGLCARQGGRSKGEGVPIERVGEEAWGLDSWAKRQSRR